MRSLYRIAFRNTLRHSRRSLAVVFAVALGFTALSLLHGFVSNLSAIFEHQARHQLMLGDLLVKKAIPPNTPPDQMARFRLSQADQAMVERVLQEHGHALSGYMRKLFIGGLATNGEATTHFFGMGYDVARGAALRGPEYARDTFAGEPLRESAPGTVVLARQLAAILDCSNDGSSTRATTTVPERSTGALRCGRRDVQLQALAASGRFSAVTVNISGLFETGTRELGRKYLMTDLATAQSLFDTNEINGYSIAVADPGYAPILRAALLKASDQAGAGLRVKPWKEFAEGAFYRSLMSLLSVFSTIVIVVTSCLSAGAVFSLLSRTITERIREIGTLRSIGYRGRHLMTMFALEGGLIALAGCAAGAALSSLVIAMVDAMDLSFTGGLASSPLPLSLHVDLLPMVNISLLLTATATAAALLPARRAAKVTITEALAHV